MSSHFTMPSVVLATRRAPYSMQLGDADLAHLTLVKSGCFGVEKEEHDRIPDTCRFKGRKQRRRLSDLDSSLYPSLVLLSLLRSGRRSAMGDETSSKFKRICVFCGSNSGNRTVFREAALDLGHELVRPR
ncbi:hypothetical protein BHM03_00057811 [Ensete ventricosum]|nr:hypothetical protein BHM03_00057811 [Ensete ventricosum]